MFIREDLNRGWKQGMYEDFCQKRVQELFKRGRMVSSDFKVRQGDNGDRKGIFKINFKRQSKHWPKGSTKVETFLSFAWKLQERDTLMSWDIRSGYRHFYLHPHMRAYFLFRYENHFYTCIVLPFGWGLSVQWLTKWLRPVVEHLHERLGCRILPYIDDFACATSALGRPSTRQDCARAGRRLAGLFVWLGIVRHKAKSCWEGMTTLEHMGCIVDTKAMGVFESEKKVLWLRRLTMELLLAAQLNLRLVQLKKRRHFCGVAVSMTLPFPLSRFYTRSF